MRARLRTLSKENAENVGLHLVMAGRLLDSVPELAYEHAQAAVRRAGRVDVVREAAGLAAYRTGRFAEALRELRTVRRLNGSSEHLAVMADCERGLGRPERALTLAASPEAEGLGSTEALELAIVVSGARLDLGEPEAAIAVLSTSAVRAATGTVAVRVAQALAAAYEAAGRHDEAREVLSGFTPAQLEEASGVVDEEDEVVVFDLDEDAGAEDGDDEPREQAAEASHERADTDAAHRPADGAQDGGADRSSALSTGAPDQDAADEASGTVDDAERQHADQADGDARGAGDEASEHVDGADHTGADHTGADHTGADHTGADRTGADRTGGAEVVGAGGPDGGGTDVAGGAGTDGPGDDVDGRGEGTPARDDAGSDERDDA